MSILTYNGNNFEQRDNDGFVNLTQMSKTTGKKIGDWTRLEKTKAYINAVATDTGIPTSQLLYILKGNFQEEAQGTWAHPLIALHFAQWISPEFHVWCNQHIKTLIETGSATIIEEHQPVERVLPTRDAVDYIEAAKDMESLPEGILKQLLRDALVDQISLEQNLKYLPVAEKPKQYTIAKVRARMLGYTDKQIGNGSQLGKFVKANIEPAFQESVGRFPVFHYEVTPELDKVIHTYFS